MVLPLRGLGLRALADVADWLGFYQPTQVSQPWGMKQGSAIRRELMIGMLAERDDQ